MTRAHVNLGVCYTNRGLLALARAHTEAALELAEAHGAALAALVATNNLALLACDAGEDERALALAHDALARATARGAQASAETFATLVRVHLARGAHELAEQALAQMRAVAHDAERPLVARIAARLVEPDAACALLAEALAGDISDPYERATTRLAYALALARAGRPSVDLEREACAALEALGADVALERRRAAG